MPHCNGYINHSQSRCQTCVPHVTCFPLLSCPYLVFLFLSSLVPSCVWFSPHLFQFSSLLPSILKPWFSPCLMSGIECLPCFIKVNVWNSPCLLAPCSPLRERDRIPDPKTGRSVSPPSFFFPVFLFSCFSLLPRRWKSPPTSSPLPTEICLSPSIRGSSAGLPRRRH